MKSKQHFLYTEGGGFRPTLVANPEAIEFIIIDLFCGAGGTTTGFANAELNGKKIALIAACVNHDPIAIKSHWRNHPEVVHFEEDIRTLNLSGLADIVLKYRIMYPNAKVILWASLECTNFSKAKGGQPRDADSRTLAENLYMHYDPTKKEYYTGDSYIQILNPDYIMIENVVEFMSWGPLDDRGKPVSKKSGSDWLRWRNDINNLGYHDQWKEINSADFGAYTSRNRLFGCFAKHGLPIVWPEPTHSKKPTFNGLFGNLEKWKPVKDVLDFDDEGKSIFGRKKPLSDKTLERIYAGLVKYVAGGKDAYLLRYNSMSKDGSFKQTATDIDNPCPTISCQNRLGMCFITKYFSGKPEGKVISVDGPAGTVTCVDGQSLVQPIPFNPAFIAKYYGNGDNINSIDEPAGTLTTKDRLTKIQAVWLDKTFSGKANHQSIEQPAGSILTNDHHNKVTAVPFIMDSSYGNVGRSVDEPAPTLLASRRHHYIVNPSHGGHSTSTDAPCPVIIARQDKAPLYLTQVIPGLMDVEFNSFFTDIDIELLEELCSVRYQNLINDNQPIYGPMIEKSIRMKILEFMIMFKIGDIKMRMLKVPELLLIQGLTNNQGKPIELEGNQSHQKKQIGNSVHPLVPKAKAETLGRRLREIRQEAA
ncbi:DNA cytosine methyltransferase [Pedobacter sp. B4-66]|uniref:DNA cytosine methyltransferase n=1 Tax=Pedobacter sp. B4-66 TaxID=2817280 RepID=UPI001BDA2D9D|nr:DNA cytosine methyltransferase [Pedobacter sp. B4-66]